MCNDAFFLFLLSLSLLQVEAGVEGKQTAQRAMQDAHGELIAYTIFFFKCVSYSEIRRRRCHVAGYWWRRSDGIYKILRTVTKWTATTPQPSLFYFHLSLLLLRLSAVVYACT